MKFSPTECDVKRKIYDAPLNVNLEWGTDCSSITNYTNSLLYVYMFSIIFL
jgi:hypothetical protein